VALRLESLDGDQATLLVIGRGLPAIQGVALRLVFDPGRLQIVGYGLGKAWDGRYPAVAFQARAEGELWAGIGLHGRQGGLSLAGEVVLARIMVALSGDAPPEIGFRDFHNLVIDPQAVPVALEWLGGRFHRQGS